MYNNGRKTLIRESVSGNRHIDLNFVKSPLRYKAPGNVYPLFISRKKFPRVIFYKAQFVVLLHFLLTNIFIVKTFLDNWLENLILHFKGGGNFQTWKLYVINLLFYINSLTVHLKKRTKIMKCLYCFNSICFLPPQFISSYIEQKIISCFEPNTYFTFFTFFLPSSLLAAYLSMQKGRDF